MVMHVRVGLCMSSWSAAPRAPSWHPTNSARVVKGIWPVQDKMVWIGMMAHVLA